jgi:hypothetical protein
VVLDGNLHAVALDERNGFPEFLVAIAELSDHFGVHAGAIDRLRTVDVQAELDQLRTDGVPDVERLLD